MVMVLTENMCCDTLVSQMKVPHGHTNSSGSGRGFERWLGGMFGMPELGKTRCLLKKPRTKHVAVV